MSFPLASVGIYSSVVFGVFSNTQRFLSQVRHGDPAAAPSLADMTLASLVAGFISVGIGTPVELVKIRLQMQTQPYNKGRKQEFLLPVSSCRSLVRTQRFRTTLFEVGLCAALCCCSWGKNSPLCLRMDLILPSSRVGFLPIAFPAIWDL